MTRSASAASAGTILLAGGGTGGHVFPSLAVAGALRDLRTDVAVEFVGTANGLEARLVPDAGWTLHTVEAAPLARRLSPATVGLPLVIWRAVRQVRAVLRRRRAVAAGVFGGYVSVPLALAARLERLPLVVHEQNAVPGLANRMAARAASAVAVTYRGQRFGRRTVEVTGNPVRPGLGPDDVTGSRAEGLDAFGLDPGRRTLLVFGGSQGARRLNTAVIASARMWSDPARLQILHVAGRREHSDVAAAWDQALDGTGSRAPRVRCVDFIDRMELAYAAADLVLCRSGASTLAELTVLGLASILVPYPHATADHQMANARALADAGGAIVVPDGELDGARVVAEAEPLLLNDELRHRVGRAAALAGRPDAAAAVATLLLTAAGLRPAPPATGESV